MAKIKSITASEIFDSRGIPTIETTITLTDNTTATSSIPQGKSLSSYEAQELRDKENRYGGLGVHKAIENVNGVIAPKLVGIEASDQKEIDKIMIEADGTKNKSNLGANAILSVSQAVLKASAKTSLLPLPLYIRELLPGKIVSKKIPTPAFNILEGGKHGGKAIEFQEFLVIPASSKSISESLEIGVSTYHSLETLLSDKSFSTLAADEGGFSPEVSTNRDALTLVKESIERLNYKYSVDVFLGIDAAANSFKSGKEYYMRDKLGTMASQELVEFYSSLFSDFSLIYIEDPFSEDDWDGWKKIFSQLSEKTLIVGDDLTATNPYRLQLAIENNVINGVIIKPNQIGTVTETIAVVEMARSKNLKIIVSARSGETNDPFIADFAVGVYADYVKFGAPARERIIKYNRLLEIERELEQI